MVLSLEPREWEFSFLTITPLLLKTSVVYFTFTFTCEFYFYFNFFFSKLAVLGKGQMTVVNTCQKEVGHLFWARHTTKS